MKNTKICSKCQASDIAKIEGSAGPFFSGNNIPVGATTISAIKVTRFVCLNCGFSEEWIESKKDLEKIGQKFK